MNGSERPRVLVIAGTGRSGSTLLANILGSFDNGFSAGELRYLWSRGIVDDAYCGCGQRLSACPCWQRILGDQGSWRDRAGTIDDALRRHTRLRLLPRLLIRKGADGASDAVLAPALTQLYASASSHTGSVIIDSSKLPSYAAILTRLDAIDVRVLHLVRDPRAAAWSWTRRHASQAAEGFEEEMGRLSPPKSALLWLLWNGATTWLWGRRTSTVPYLRVRYEDFVSDPETAVAAIARFADLEGAPPFVEPSVADVRISHQVAGNPNRLRRGRTPIRPDDEWRTQIPARTSRFVDAITAPVRRRLGYSGARR